MALRPLNSEGGFGIDSGNIIIQSNGAVTTSNLSVSDIANIANLVVTQLANLGAISNVFITGGTAGQVITTDGSGNLSFTTPAAGGAGQMPYYIPTGETYTVDENKQGLFAVPITIDGDLVVNGLLVQVNY
jgi:hypothetical protein